MHFTTDMADHSRFLTIIVLTLIASTLILTGNSSPSIEEGNFSVFYHPDTSKPTLDWFSLQKSQPSPKEPKAPCQEIICLIDTAECYPLPDTNVFLYFRSCLGDSVKLVAKGVYPENGTTYTQNDTLSTFHWIFGDGNTATTDTNFVWHTYDSAKGYDASMYIEDTNRCQGIPVVYRVTVTQNPVNTINPLPQKCLGDTSAINATTFANYSSYSYSQVTSQSFDSMMFIPDGPNCDPTNPCYYTDVYFTSFLPSQTITAASDILSICVLMEHTYVNDMSFFVVCPNGQRARLKEYVNVSGGANMGQPSNVTSNDPKERCLPEFNPPGVPWNYCWSELYPNIGTILQNANQAQLDSTDRTNNLNYYLPDASLDSLIGCPLNGRWSIEICDKWAADNGYIFHWDMTLSPALLPQAWGFQAVVDSTWVDGPFIVGNQGQTTLICPTDTGNFEYTVFIADDFGCVWDTTVMMRVNPVPTVNLGNDTSFCAGNSLTLTAGTPPNTFQWNTNSTQPSIVVSQSGVYSVEVTTPLNCSATDSVQVVVRTLPLANPIRHE